MSLDFRIETVALIDSTNRWVRDMAAAGAEAGLVLRADRQQAGRGRLGRVWESPAGNLYMSLLLRPATGLPAAANLTFVAALALAEFLDPLLPPGISPRLKWPNDVLVSGAKISGILLEAEGDGARCASAILGIGLNLVSHPEKTLYPATDLHAAGGPILSPAAALAGLLDRLRATYDLWEKAGFAPIRAAWLARAAGLDAPIAIDCNGKIERGIFRGLDEAGHLLLERDDGRSQRIAAADIVSHL